MQVTRGDGGTRVLVGLSGSLYAGRGPGLYASVHLKLIHADFVTCAATSS